MRERCLRWGTAAIALAALLGTTQTTAQVVPVYSRRPGSTW